MRMPVSTAHTHSSEYFLIFLHLSWVRFEVLTFHKAAAKQISFFLILFLFRSKIRANKSKSERSAHAEKKYTYSLLSHPCEDGRCGQKKETTLTGLPPGKIIESATPTYYLAIVAYT